MRLVADTNIVVSGLLWRGNPRLVLDAARSNALQLYTSITLLAELDEILQRQKFAQRLSLASVTARELVLGYAALATVVNPTAIDPVVIDDPDDDDVLACAVAAQAEIIVSGDSHLLDLKIYRDIEILTAAQLLSKIES